MRVLVIILALVLACAAAVLAEDMSNSSSFESTISQSSSSAAPSGIGMGSASTTGDQVVDTCMAQCLNISSQQINSMRAQGMSNSDIAMAAAISVKSGAPISDVVSQWQTNKDWSQVAGRYNLSMSDLAVVPTGIASMDAESFNTCFISQYYNVPQAQIQQLRKQGYSWGDISLFANAAVRTNQQITQIVAMRQQGQSWADIAKCYNVACETLISPVPMRCVTTTCVPATTGAGPCPQPCAPCPAPAPTCGPCDLPCPTPVMSGAGPGTLGTVNVPCFIYDYHGGIILNEDDAIHLYASGYDWLDVAVAANISRYIGIPIRQVLISLTGAGTWWNLIYDWGVPAEIAFNVADYPFPRRSIYSQSVEDANLRAIDKYQQAGLWPTCSTLCKPTCQPVCPQPCPTPCPVCPPGTVPNSMISPSGTTQPTVPMTTPTPDTE